MFEITRESYKEAEQYLKDVGELDNFLSNKTSIDGYSLIAYANSILEQES